MEARVQSVVVQSPDSDADTPGAGCDKPQARKPQVPHQRSINRAHLESDHLESAEEKPSYDAAIHERNCSSISPLRTSQGAAEEIRPNGG